MTRRIDPRFPVATGTLLAPRWDRFSRIGRRLARLLASARRQVTSMSYANAFALIGAVLCFVALALLNKPRPRPA